MGAAVALLVALALVGFLYTRSALLARRLPPLPDLSSAPASVVDHLRDADRGARAAPTSVQAVSHLCVAYQADLFYPETDRCYGLLEDLDPDDWRWTYLRALARGDRGDGEALADGMRRVVDIAPDVGPAWWHIAEAEFKEGRYEEASAAFRRARAAPETIVPTESGARVRTAPIPLAAYADLGLARISLLGGDAEEAQRILLNLTTEQPRLGPAFRLLAEAYRQLGLNEAAARTDLEANRLPPYVPYADPLVDMLARESRNSTFLLQQAAGGYVAIDPEWTEFLLRRGLDVDPANPDLVLALGQLLRRAGHHEEALALFRKHYEMVPADPQALGQVGVSLLDLGRFGEAESLFRRVLDEVNDADTHYNLGTLLAATGRMADAADEFERALALEPNRSDARSRLAVILIREGAIDRAIVELERVIALEPNDDSARTNLGLAFVEQGQVDRAIREFREALRINPAQRQAQIALRALGAAVP